MSRHSRGVVVARRGKWEDAIAEAVRREALCREKFGDREGGWKLLVVRNRSKMWRDRHCRWLLIFPR